MKNKYLLIRIAGIVFLILLVIIYFAGYFVPTIKEISFQKRQLKDMNLKIADFMKMENTFTFSNSQERELFKVSQAELEQKIPLIRHREDYIALFTRVSSYIQQQAKADGVFNLVFTSDSQEMQIETGSLSTNKRILEDLLTFSSQRLEALKKQQVLDGRDPNSEKPGLAALVPGVIYHTVWLSFTAELPAALNFINHIPRIDNMLSEDQIIVASGAGMPYFIVSLKVFFVDARGETPAGNSR